MADNGVVKYDNKLNLLAFKGVTKLEYDLFFSILSKLKNQGTSEIVLTYAEITQHMGWNLTVEETAKALIKGVEKIVKTAIKWETETSVKIFTLFEVFEIPNTYEPYLKVKINNTFKGILNDFNQGFTVWELAEFTDLSSKYTQTLYRLLKQFRSTGKLILEWNNFIDLMDIPKSYAMSDIDKQILKPSVKELSEKTLFNQKNTIFKNLRYEKEYYAKRGRPIKSITFYFDAEKSENQIQKEISKKITKEIKENFAPIKNEISDWTAQYIGMHYTKKSKFGGYETCKILELKENSDGVFLKAKNQENEKIFTAKFKNKSNFMHSIFN